MGNNSCKVITCQHVTNQDDHVAQLNETIGTMKILDNLEVNNVTVETWAHEYNTTVNRLVEVTSIPLTTFGWELST